MKMNKKRFLVIGMLIICIFAGIILVYLQERNNLDQWIGTYYYTEAYPHPSGLMNYVTSYEITIYRQDKEYYAVVTGGGWFLDLKVLAHVRGNKNEISIYYMENLLEEHGIYNKDDIYEKEEELIQFVFDEDGMLTVWKALRNQHPLLTEEEGDIIGIYFERSDNMRDRLSESMEAWVEVP